MSVLLLDEAIGTHARLQILMLSLLVRGDTFCFHIGEHD